MLASTHLRSQAEAAVAQESEAQTLLLQSQVEYAQAQDELNGAIGAKCKWVRIDVPPAEVALKYFGYKFGYRRQFALISASYAKLRVGMGFSWFTNYARLRLFIIEIRYS
jgi:hypothetical protein